MKTNKEARKILRRVYNNLARSVEAAADLEVFFSKEDDKRLFKAREAVRLIMKAQETVNPLAEDEDIRLV
jgi:hypothetical protein